MAEVDELIAGIILNETGLDADRIVLYNQNYNEPTDDNLFIIVATGQFYPLAVNNKFDPDTNQEIKTVTGYTVINVELTSRNRQALERKEEILQAIISTYSQQVQEENSIKIMRAGDILDLSAVEGASALHRFRVPLSVSSVKIKRTVITPIDKFRIPEVNSNG